MGWFFGKGRFRSTYLARACQPADSVALANLHRQGFERAWGVAEFDSLLCDQSVMAHLATTRLGNGAGFILSRIAADEAEILSIVVASKARRYGVGSLLLQKHLASLAQRRAESLFLEVDELNEPALALYRRFGFEAVGTRKSYYNRADGSTPAAIVMKRSLK